MKLPPRWLVLNALLTSWGLAYKVHDNGHNDELIKLLADPENPPDMIDAFESMAATNDEHEPHLSASSSSGLNSSLNMHAKKLGKVAVCATGHLCTFILPGVHSSLFFLLLLFLFWPRTCCRRLPAVRICSSLAMRDAS